MPETNTSKYTFKIITANELIANERLLKQAFAILVSAHYQTKPSDLQLLLDNPKIKLACLFNESYSDNADINVSAIALLMSEGACDEVNQADVQAIKDSHRRLRDHFLPQSLLTHCGFESAFSYNYLRILRIAVLPQLQQQGLGQLLLRHIETYAVEKRIDFIGSSFGLNCPLLSFWFNAGFVTSRIGFTQDKASGEHSGLLLKGVNTESRQVAKQLNQEFYRSFDYLLLDEYKNLSSSLVLLLLIKQPSETLTPLSATDIANVKAFSSGQRQYSSCVYSLYLWLKHELLKVNSSFTENSINDELVMLARLIQKHDIKSVCLTYKLTGKKMLSQFMQSYINQRLFNS